MTPFALYDRLRDQLRVDDCVALITIKAARGSTPQKAGAAMMVTKAGAISGTIGGGALEYSAIQDAVRFMESGQRGDFQKLYPLGPDLGQCCGGSVEIETSVFSKDMTDEIAARRAALDEVHPTPVALFGAGHVGRAVVIALATLPFQVTWIDEREGIFPDTIPRNVTVSQGDDLEQLIAALPHHSYCLIMTHSHALDFALVDAALRRDDLDYIGLIGSSTKRARFHSRLRQSGVSSSALSRMVCPIGLPSLYGKDPAVIAASVAADLLIRRQALQAGLDRGSMERQEKRLAII